jgi:putative ABC transport system permease protein
LVERFFSLQDKTKTFEEQTRQLPNVDNAGSTSALIGKEGDFFGVQFQPEGSNEVLTVKMMGADDYFAQTVNFELKEGKLFAEGTQDSLSIILNESAVKVFGLKDPIGARLRNNAPDNDGNEIARTFTVIGIVKDFHFQSLRDKITPLAIQSSEFFGFKQYLAVKIKPGQTHETIQQLENQWKQLMPEQPFRYSFLDDQLKTSYAEEKRSGQLFSVFSALAIIIACVGLFGLSAYTASLRTKEIGVRKVLGASVTGITLLLSKEFTKLVFVAFVLAAPIAWWAMNNWLQSFAYRITPGVGSFLFAGLAALSIAWLTVSYQSIKAAMVNPVKSLRSE